MPKNHLKVQHTPNTWPIKRKNATFITRPHPGAHKMELSLPLNIIFKKLLGKAKTNKEVTKLLHNHEILLNGKRKKDYKQAMGLLDILFIPTTGESYTMLIGTNKKLTMQEIDKKEASQKICKIVGKKIVKKGVTQLKTHDGRTILVKKDEYKTGESILLSIPKQEIKQLLKLEAGACILLTGGKYVGKIASVVEINADVLRFKHDSKEFETKKDYATVIGKDKPLINIK